MRHPILLSLSLAGITVLAACDQSGEAQVNRAIQDVNVIDETNLNDVMLAAADPSEAVNYFQGASSANPDRIDLKRGLGLSLVRDRRASEAVPVWTDIIAHPEATNDDRVELADAQIRTGDWDGAGATLNAIPPTHETFKRYRLEAMVADSKEQWSKADSFYETAVGLTTQPASVLNNWGFSKLTRGDAPGAERLFADAIRNDPDLFTAKNNLVLARGAQRQYDLPVVKMTQVERAQLMYTMALTAVKQGDVATGRGLLRDAIETHPQHFEAAARSLETLEDTVGN